MTRTGGCRCGAVRYAITAGPVATRLCWCRDCQYWAAGNAAVNIIVPRSTLQVEGQPRVWESLADSGHRMRRSFCGECGTPVFSEARENPDYLVIRVGTLDESADIRPDVVIWTDSAPAWTQIDPALKAFPRQPS